MDIYKTPWGGEREKDKRRGKENVSNYRTRFVRHPIHKHWEWFLYLLVFPSVSFTVRLQGRIVNVTRKIRRDGTTLALAMIALVFFRL